MNTPNPLPRVSDDFEGIDLQKWLHLFLRWSWLIIICVLTAVFLGLAYIQHTVPVYEAQALLQVEEGQKKVLKVEEVRQESLKDLESLRTVEQNLYSRDLLNRVVTSEKLAEHPDFLPPKPWWKKGLALIGVGAASKQDADDLVKTLSDMVFVKLRRGTRLIQISVEHYKPEMAKQLTAAMIREFQRWTWEQHAGVSQTAYQFLREEAERLKERVRKSELALQKYREEAGSVSLEEKHNIVVDRLKELNSKLTDASAFQLQLSADYKQAEKLVARGDIEALLSLPSLASDEVLMELQQELDKERANFANMKQRYKPKHPKYIQTQSKVQEMERSLREGVLTAVDRLKVRLEASKNSEENMRLVLNEQEKTALDLGKNMVEYHNLVREAESDQMMYQNVLSRLKETDVSRGLEADIVRVVESPRVSDKPVKPRKLLVLAGALAGGLLLGVFLVLLFNLMDTSIQTMDQAEHLLGVPVLGAVPRSEQPLAQPHELVLIRKPDTIVAESFRTLRASLSLLGVEEDRRTFLFTSAVPTEGKSFICSNYAVALAQQNLRTLLIDSDLRRPTISKYFSIGKNVTGTTDCLIGRKKLSQAVVPTKIQNLDVLPSGTHAPNPSELLSSDTFRRLLEEAAERYDRVVVDTAPVTSVSDTLLIARYAQTACLVVKFGKTPKKVVQRAVRMLEHAEARLGGVVLNGVPRHGGYYYHYYSSDYYSQKG